MSLHIEREKCTRFVSRREFLRPRRTPPLSQSRQRNRAGRRRKTSPNSSCNGTNGSGGGGDGATSDGGGSDGDDDGAPNLAIKWQWWQVSVVVACASTFLVLLLLLYYRILVRSLPVLLASTFVGTLLFVNHLNPEQWFRRMAEVCVAALIGNNMLGGLSIGALFPSLESLALISIPSPNWSSNAVLTLLAALFTWLHHIRHRARRKGG